MLSDSLLHQCEDCRSDSKWVAVRRQFSQNAPVSLSSSRYISSSVSAYWSYVFPSSPRPSITRIPCWAASSHREGPRRGAPLSPSEAAGWGPDTRARSASWSEECRVWCECHRSFRHWPLWRTTFWFGSARVKKQRLLCSGSTSRRIRSTVWPEAATERESMESPCGLVVRSATYRVWCITTPPTPTSQRLLRPKASSGIRLSKAMLTMYMI